MVLFNRPTYLDRISPYTGQNLIKIIIGQRRVGKSSFLHLLAQQLQQKKDKQSVIFIDKERFEFDTLLDYRDLMVHIEKNRSDNDRQILMIDEIQDIQGFERAIRSLHNEDRFDIYISGSNARLLSGELATLLSGRYIECKLYSLSFQEFCQFHQKSSNKESLQHYLRYGGLPYLYHLELADEIVFDYLQNIYRSILLKDVVARYQIRNVDFLENLVKYLSIHTGHLISAKKISDFLKSQRIQVGPNVILNYLNHLSDAFIIHRVKRHDIIGKRLFEIGEKIYFQDLGLKHAIIPPSIEMIGQDLENLIHNHLVYSGYTVHIGKLGNKEIDFICSRSEQRLYVQVAYLLADESTRQREFGNLLAIPDNYRKIVVSLDDLPPSSVKGIEWMNVLEFLNTIGP